jgi:3',5'-cyclic AMP phosphodiesterase CpdA
MYRLLQLSDIHFGRDHAFGQDGRPPTARTFREAILLGLEENCVPLSFDALILSGDIFTTRAAGERAEARLQLQQLARAAGATSVIMVPGNHDVDWDAKPADKLYDYKLLAQALGASVDLPAVHIIEHDHSKPLAIVALDSCQLESEAQRGLGLVGERQLDALSARMREARISADTHTVVAVLHHHLLPVGSRPVLPATANPGDSDRLVVSVTVDATIVIRRLVELGASLVLHGHQHATTIMKFGLQKWDHGPLYVAAAGSSGVRRGEVRRQFFVWEITDRRAHVISLRHREDDLGRFEHDPDNSGDLDLR